MTKATFMCKVSLFEGVDDQFIYLSCSSHFFWSIKIYNKDLVLKNITVYIEFMERECHGHAWVLDRLDCRVNHHRGDVF